MKKEFFGKTPDGKDVYAYTLKNGDMAARILDLGGTVVNLYFKGRDIVCGFENTDKIFEDNSYQGALIGRVANRIGDARFTLNGKTYYLSKNDGNNHLHGGNVGFNRHIWTVEKATDTTLSLSLFSPDGDENYPGNLKVKVEYTFYPDAMAIHYTAVSDADTPVNLTNHSYFNIDGYDSGSILNHKVRINADKITEVTDNLIPTGKSIEVDGTVFDLRDFTRIGEYIGSDFGGYDNNFILNLDKNHERTLYGRTLYLAAEVIGEKTGTKMSVYTDRPCMQLYIGNALTGKPDFKGGYKKAPHTTYCFETQCEPDAPNHGTGILRAGETFDTETVFSFE
ncbi:MAG: aldose epimerase family protein [Eubacteriales bacterium]|nr:aldose epimerase family protein [Eubacteriales bacterium]